MTMMLIGMFAVVLPHPTFQNPVLKLGALAGQETMGIFLIHLSFLDLWVMNVPLPDSVGFRILEVAFIFLMSWLTTLILKRIPGMRKLFQI